LAPQAGVEYHGLSITGFDRSRPWTLLTGGIRTLFSAVKAWFLLGRLRADVVIGFGAYVSLPVAFAAFVRRVPLVIHEQNSVPGLANRVLSRFADAVAITYECSKEHFARPERAVLTGNPVRADVLGSSRASGREWLGLTEECLVLLVFGGSRGARHLNSAVVALKDALLAMGGLHVIHVAGPAEADEVRAALAGGSEAGGDVGGGEAVASDGASDTDAGGRWRVYDYLDDMGKALAASDLVLCRAGATTLAELTALGVPAVVVPYPHATDDHQSKNAAAAVEAGAVVSVEDSELDGDRLAAELTALLGDESLRATMSAASRMLGRTDAAERVAVLVGDVYRDRRMRTKR